MKIRALWVDDGAVADLVELTGPVVASGRYTLNIAESISAAIGEMQQREFDVVVVDIRLPPGDLDEWIRLYQKGGQSRVTAKLGLEFLKACLDPNAQVTLNPLPTWARRPERFGVFTVEEKEVMERQVNALGVKIYHRKEVDPGRRKLLEIINQVWSDAA
jgi:CheY-like chemotaxis protein